MKNIQRINQAILQLLWQAGQAITTFIKACPAVLWLAKHKTFSKQCMMRKFEFDNIHLYDNSKLTKMF